MTSFGLYAGAKKRSPSTALVSTALAIPNAQQFHNIVTGAWYTRCWAAGQGSE